MSDVSNLQSRIDAEFSASQQDLKRVQAAAVETYEGRQQRLVQFEQVCTQLGAVWQPKLDVLAEKFGGNVKVTPRVTKGLREATFDVRSSLATVQLKFSASTDTDVRKIVLDYNLEILPILMEFTRHSRIEFPLDAVDSAAAGKWIDDRIVEFVRTYLALSQNEYYLKDHMVTDPIAGVTFPKQAAGATLERQGKTYYFISEKTRSEFEQQGSAAKGASS